MAPAELRVPEAMIALDLWLPAVQEVNIENYALFKVHQLWVINLRDKCSFLGIIDHFSGLSHHSGEHSVHCVKSLIY